jgi:hypothetical protein
VLIREDGHPELFRRRETCADLFRLFVILKNGRQRVTLVRNLKN